MYFLKKKACLFALFLKKRFQPPTLLGTYRDRPLKRFNRNPQLSIL